MRAWWQWRRRGRNGGDGVVIAKADAKETGMERCIAVGVTDFPACRLFWRGKPRDTGWPWRRVCPALALPPAGMEPPAIGDQIEALYGRGECSVRPFDSSDRHRYFVLLI